MSLDEYRGAAYAFAHFMREAAADIESGKRKGVRIKFKGPNLAKVYIGRFALRILKARRSA